MFPHFQKRPLAHSIAVAVLGTSAGLGMTTANADSPIGSPGDIASNNADPAEVIRSGNPDQITFRLPQGETDITISGYVKADFILDTEADIGDSFFANAIPTGDNVDERAFRFHARQSRLTIRSNTDVGSKELKSTIELDFFGGGGNQILSNSDGFRLRHAYITYGRWTVGQVWTNFMDFVAYPSTVDFFGPAGKSFIRQAQIRYTLENGFSFSLENPETTGTFSDGTGVAESLGGAGRDQLPDITAAWRGGPGGVGGSYETAAVVRSLGVGGVTDDQTFGWGINLAGAWDFGFGKVASSFTTGSGIGRYLINGIQNGDFVNVDGSLDSVTATGFNLSYLHRWSGTATSTIAYGQFVNDSSTPANGIDELRTVHINYMMKPLPALTLGGEVIIGSSETSDGSSGDNVRFQVAGQLNF